MQNHLDARQKAMKRVDAADHWQHLQGLLRPLLLLLSYIATSCCASSAMGSTSSQLGT